MIQYLQKQQKEGKVFVNKVDEIVMLIPKSSEWGGFLSSLNMFSEDFMENGREQEAAVPIESPNADTPEAFAELENGGGHTFIGITKQLFTELTED